MSGFSLPGGTRLIIFDADETLRRTTVPGQPCPHGPGEWELLPGVQRTLRRYRWGEGGLLLGIASNQDHVGYGLLSRSMAHRLLRDLALAAVGPICPAPRVELCPHRPEERCQCRKPMPGMIETIMRHFRLPPVATLCIGNSDCDREAALRAGTRFAWAEEFFDYLPL